MATVTEADKEQAERALLTEAVERLSNSGRGRDAMRWLLRFLRASGLGLDSGNKRSMYRLIDGAWTSDKGSLVLELLSQQVGDEVAELDQPQLLLAQATQRSRQLQERLTHVEQQIGLMYLARQLSSIQRDRLNNLLHEQL